MFRARSAKALRQGVIPGRLAVRDVYAARNRLRGLIRRTPLHRSGELSRRGRADVRLKLDSFQDTRSFKLRGTGNAVIALPRDRVAAGLVTYSTGNHGRAMVHVARQLGLRSVICVSERVPADKIRSLEKAGCELVVEGRSQDDAVAAAHRLASDRGLFFVDPINDPNFIAGHGTLGLELVEDWPELDTVVVPVSGGALISGVALAVKALKPSVRVVGVSMERGAAMYQSLQAGRPVLVDEVDSLADSLQGGILLDNRYTFEMTRQLVDELVLVSEAEIGRAVAWAMLRERVVLEGAAATPIAAWLFRGRESFGSAVALLGTGAMIDPSRLAALVVEHRASIHQLARTVGGSHES